MKQKSRTAKARYLQNIVKDYIIKLYPSLTKKDIRTSLTGENSADIKLLTPTARKLFPYSVECKNQEKLNIWESYSQAVDNCKDYEPVVVIKRNNHKPLVVVDAEYFVGLHKDET